MSEELFRTTQSEETTKAPTLRERKTHQLNRACKRIIDVVGSLVGLTILAPIGAILSLWIVTDSPGPILYGRPVIGFNRRRFTAYKFRSMVPDAHERMMSDPELLKAYQKNLKIDNDPRVTTSGRYLRRSSLDELPQLFNVLKGDMSLVGPRMLGDVELERYGPHKDLVLACKPGITGLWQVNGRNSTTFDRRIELDLDYVRNWSLWLDLKILLKTLPVVITGKGAL